MKSTTLNRWLKIVAWLWAMVIVVMLLIPAALTDEQLTQIKPGMTIQQVQQLLGQPCSGGRMVGVGTRFQIQRWSWRRNWWRQHLSASIPDDTISLMTPVQRWVGGTSLLLVAHEDGMVTKTWLFPITRSGGGLKGCIDTIKEYWNDWWK